MESSAIRDLLQSINGYEGRGLHCGGSMSPNLFHRTALAVPVAVSALLFIEYLSCF